MDFRRLPADESAIERFIEDLVQPYHRELAETVDTFGLAAEYGEQLDEQREFWMDSVSDADFEVWVAVDGMADPFAALADTAGEFAGFITTTPRPSPSVFSWPDRLVIGDFFVHEEYRGTDLAGELIDRAVERARAEGHEEFLLNVDVDNERAKAFYEKLGFDTYRFTLTAPIPDVEDA